MAWLNHFWKFSCDFFVDFPGLPSAAPPKPATTFSCACLSLGQSQCFLLSHCSVSASNLLMLKFAVEVWCDPSWALSQRRSISRMKCAVSFGEWITSRVSSFVWASEFWLKMILVKAKVMLDLLRKILDGFVWANNSSILIPVGYLKGYELIAGQVSWASLLTVEFCQ